MIDTPFEIYNNWKSFQNDIENIKSNLFKNAYPPFLIDKVITLDYQISATSHTIPKKKKKNTKKKKKKKKKKKNRNLPRSFVKISLTITHSKLKIIFHIKTQFLML